MSAILKVIDIGKDFSRYPAGRYEADGPFSGELFRSRFLVPALDSKEQLTIELDSTAGYGSSFLEEAFGGLVRLGYSANQIKSVIVLNSEDPSLLEEIEEYILDAELG
ncbi:MAG: STAS-like domain-containing protein [Methylococcaceae bacterium]